MNKQKKLFQKLNFRLALLFTTISSLILLIMSLCYLYISEKDLKKTSYLSFCGEINTIIANLEQQDTITYQWLSKIEQNGKYLIAVYDNGSPLSYTQMARLEEQLATIDEIMTYGNSTYNFNSKSIDSSSLHYEFEYTATDKSPYYVSFAQIPRRSSTLSSIILYPTSDLYHKLQRQHLNFIILNLTGILLLFLVSLFFTRRLLQPVKQSQDKQTAFIASASHELRTPLAVILSSLSALRTSDSTMKPQFLATIESESKRMSILINDMLTLARADSQTWSFTMTQVELDTLLLESYEAFDYIAKEHDLSLSILLPEDSIPSCLCDKDRITQVLAILINNAICYSKPQGNVKLKLVHTSSDFIVSVIDNGIGISDKAKVHIFDRFYREDCSRSQKEHFGLGLCIAKEIIDEHNGKIRVFDTLGGGTTFQVILPIS
ncbi:sensor histidine kinase [Anaerosporobacter sp.]